LFVLLGIAGGCAAPPKPAVAPPDAGSSAARAPDPGPASTKFQSELEQARAKRREAEAIVFVRPADEPSSDTRIEVLVEWLKRREAATAEADGAYAAAREQAAPPEQVLVARERGELYWGLFEAKVNATLAIFPGIAEASAERVTMLRTNLVGRFQSDSNTAREYFVACLMLSNQLGLKNAVSARCEGQIRVIDALRPPEKKRDRALEEWQFVRVKDTSRMRRPVARGAGCALSGSAKTNFTRLYTAASGTDYDLVLEDFDVVALELPAKRGERAKLSIDYPFKASGYIDWDSGVVETSGRIDLVPGHLWLHPQSPVGAFGFESGQVSIEGERSGKTEPPVTLRVPCAQLALSREAPPPAPEVKGETSQISGVVPLFEAPAGKRIGQIDSDMGVNVRVLKRQTGWARVTNVDAGASFSTPYEFDAWVPERFAAAGKEGFELRTLGPVTKAPTHITTGPLPLRLSSEPNAAVVASLAPGVTILVGSEQGGMRRIRFNQAHGHNEGNDFWVSREDLASRTSVVPDAKVAPADAASGNR